jgi:peptidoglycan/xylan/chitin deacetylase (PgdA/CDA1 family)
MIDAMIRNDWELDSHTMTHASLPGLPPDRLSYQVARSRHVLQKRFAVPVDFFCDRAGAYNSTVIAAVRRAGYQGATTTQPASRAGPSHGHSTGSASPTPPACDLAALLHS